MIPKFRAWDMKKNIFTNYQIIDGMLRFMDKFTGVWIRDDNQDRFVLIQSTGLKDKNGVEIFEGDIVHWKDCEPIDDEIVYEDTFVVYWSDEFLMWKAKNEDTGYIDLYDYSDNRELEVIGNIFEDGDLIDG